MPISNFSEPSPGGKPLEKWTSLDYPEEELELFEKTKNWKGYWGSVFRPYVRDRVLEVSAGRGGGNTQLLCSGSELRWTCMEPDPVLASEIRQRIENGVLPKNCEVFEGILQNLPTSECYDTILYIDVLEHIQDDMAEIRQATNHLSPTGQLIVLSPAHNWLYSQFDSAVGHYRRYTRKKLQALATQSLLRGTTIYLDSVGLFLSLGNRLLLHRRLPSLSQIMFWDRWIVPLSRYLGLAEKAYPVDSSGLLSVQGGATCTGMSCPSPKSLHQETPCIESLM